MAQTNKQRQKKLLQKAAKRKKHEVERKKKHQLRKQEEELNNAVAYAIELIQEKNFNDAEKLLNQLVLTHTQNGYVYYAFGLLYVTSENIKKGIVCLEKAIELDAAFAGSYYNLGLAYYNEFYLHKMLDVLNRMFDSAHYDDECFTKGRKLISDCQKIVKETDNISLEEYCANQQLFDDAFVLMSSKKYEEAINLFSILLKDDPEHVQCYGNIGICYAQSGQRGLALKNFNQALKFDPKYELAVVNKAMTERLKEGEKLNANLSVTEYYKDYSQKDKSYIEELSNSLTHQENKK